MVGAYTIVLAVVSGCTPPVAVGSPPVPDAHLAGRWARDPQVLFGGPNTRTVSVALGGTLDDDVYPRRQGAVPDRFPIGGTIDRASVNNEIGQALEDWFDDQPAADVAQYGMSLLTLADLYGDGNSTATEGLCEDMELLWDFRENGRDYEGSVGLWGYSFFSADILPMTWDFDAQTACRDALRAAAGDVDAAIATGACNRGHELSFFRAGSECRACVEERAGDFGSCVDETRCEENQQLVDSVTYQGLDETVWFDAFYTFTPACAPGYTSLALLYANEKEGQTVPAPFDHNQWAHLCVPHWNDDFDGPVFYCSGSTLPSRLDGEVRVQGVLGPTRFIREAGSAAMTWADRRYFASEIRLGNGIEIFDGWSGSPGGGVLSAPGSHVDTNGDGTVGLGDENFGQQYIGYGLNPYQLRPDGSDPSNVDHTFARDWVAASVLKTSTHTNGVPILMANHSRCRDWEGVQGASRCRDMGPPDAGWLNDAESWWFDAAHQRPYAHLSATIGSTGLPDPSVPGGIVVGVAASAVFAEDNFEGCDGYPHTFVPDLVSFPDEPDVYDGTSSVTGDGWDFENPAIDGMGAELRVVLSTNWVRHHCPTNGLE